MCIIIAKPAGVALPPREHFERAFNNNTDGSGLAYNDGTRTYLRKGFMEFTDFETALSEISNPTERDMIFHFRIATHGKICPENCHPFPLTSSLPQLQRTSLDYGGWIVCHNGIIPKALGETDGFYWKNNWIENKGSYTAPYSDTQKYIMERLSLLGTSIFNPIVQEWIEAETGSSLWAVLTKNKLSLIGSFTEKLGVFYSNSSAFYSAPTFYGGYSYENPKYYSEKRGGHTVTYSEALQTFVHEHNSEVRCSLCNTPVYTLYECPYTVSEDIDDDYDVCSWCFSWLEDNAGILTIEALHPAIEKIPLQLPPKAQSLTELLENLNESEVSNLGGA